MKKETQAGALTTLKNWRWSSLGVVAVVFVVAATDRFCCFLRTDSKSKRRSGRHDDSSSFTTIFMHLQLTDIFSFLLWRFSEPYYENKTYSKSPTTQHIQHGTIPRTTEIRPSKTPSSKISISSSKNKTIHGQLFLNPAPLATSLLLSSIAFLCALLCVYTPCRRLHLRLCCTTFHFLNYTELPL